jgi:predicted transcriptional regulator
MPIMTIRLSRQESARVAQLAKRKDVSRSQVVRDGLAALEASEPASAWQAWEDVAGIARGGPKDLSSNPKHLKGYGR